MVTVAPSVKLLEIIALYTWNGWILCYLKYTTIKLFIKKIQFSKTMEGCLRMQTNHQLAIHSLISGGGDY